MVTDKAITLLPSTSATKLELRSFDGGRPTLSKPRCICVPASYFCQPVMDATKALAERLRRRNSRWRDRKGSAARSTTSNNPVAVAGRDPPTSAPATAPETEKASLTADPPKANVETPSPGSDVSPTSQAPPKQVDIGKHDAEKATENPTAETTVGYFSQKAADDSPTKDAPACKITFSIPTKDERQVCSGLNAGRDSKEFDTAMSSAAPSTAVSPRTSQEDEEEEEEGEEEEDVGRSSTVSFSGEGSRQSSIASVAFRMPDGSLPQGRARRHRNSLPPSSR